MSEKYAVPPYCDFFIRTLYGDQRNIRLLLSFINAVNKRAGLPLITGGTIRNPYNPKENIMEKESIVDVKVTDQNHQTYDIEVQVAPQRYFVKRSLYYFSKIYAQQLAGGDDYYMLNPVVTINILNFNLPELENTSGYYNMFRLRNEESPHDVLTSDLVMHFLELPRFSGKMADELEQWLTLFKYGNKDEVMAEVTNSEVKEAHHLYQNFNSQRDWVQEFVEWRRQHEEQLYKNMSEEHGYQRGFERGLHDGQLAGFEAGHQEGMATGRKEGIEQGIAQGIEQGIIKGCEQGKLEIAKKMLKDGISIDVVAKYTGLPIDKLNDIKEVTAI